MDDPITGSTTYADVCQILKARLPEIAEEWRRRWDAAGGRSSPAVSRTASRIAGAAIDAMGLVFPLEAAAEERLENVGSSLALVVAHVGDLHPLLQELSDVILEQAGVDVPADLAVRLPRIMFLIASSASTRFVQEIEQKLGPDALTGLMRRGRFETDLEDAVAQAGRLGKQVVLAIADLDDLKVHNTTGGMQAGDAALKGLAEALQGVSIVADGLYRWGGDEFTLIFQNATGEEVFVALQFARDSGAPAFSFGVATYPDEAPDMNELWLAAEARLKSDKSERKAGR